MARISLITTLEINRDVLVPISGWDIITESSEWYTAYPIGRELGPFVFFYFRFTGKLSETQGVFLCVGDDRILQYLLDHLRGAKTWPALDILRADVTPEAETVKTAWADERRREEGVPIGEKLHLPCCMAGFHEDPRLVESETGRDPLLEAPPRDEKEIRISETVRK